MKKIPLFYNGKRLKDVYPYATKFEVFKFKVTRFFRKVVIVTGAIAFLAGVAVGSFKIGQVTPGTKYVMADSSNAMFASKIDSLENGVVAQVSSCEDTGHIEGLIIFDTNHKPSIGIMQFQVTTVIRYEKQLYGNTIDAKQAELIALDDTQSLALAKDVMFKTSNMASADWYNCSQRYGSDAQIKLIKSLSN